MKAYYDHPVALLVACDGAEQVIGVSDPPMPTYEKAIPSRLSIVADTPTEIMNRHLYPRRVFRLNRHCRSRDHQWLRVYNEGRSQTPEDAYVYFEVVSKP